MGFIIFGGVIGLGLVCAFCDYLKLPKKKPRRT
jgi:hypothetical protein